MTTCLPKFVAEVNASTAEARRDEVQAEILAELQAIRANSDQLVAMLDRVTRDGGAMVTREVA